MGNFFDQFDGAPTTQASSPANFFDQFDADAAPAQNPATANVGPGGAALSALKPFAQTLESGINSGANVIRPFLGQQPVNNSPDLDALREKGWNGATAPEKVGAIEEALMNSPPGQIAGAVGGTLVNVPTTLIGMANEALEKLGLPHQYAQAIEMALPVAARAVPEAAPLSEEAVRQSAPVPKAYSSIAADLVKTQGMTPEDAMKAAESTQSDIGPAMTLPEASGSPSLLARQRVIGEQGNQAGSIFQNFNQDRLANQLPDAKQALVEQAGNGNISTLTDAGSALQARAQAVIKAATDARTEAATPRYQEIKAIPLADEDFMALRTNPVVENEYQTVIGNDALMEKENQFKRELPEDLKQYGNLAPEALAQLLQQMNVKPKLVKTTTGGLPDNSIGAFDNVKKNLSSQLQTLLERDPGNAMVPKLAQARTQINETLGNTSDTYRTANSEYAAASPEITAMQKGPLGQLARAQTGENAARTFMNMTREQKQLAVSQLGDDDGVILPQVASAILREVTDKTAKARNNGMQAYIDALSGDKTVRDSMEAILSPQAFEAQQALVQTLQKIQKGQIGGSNTQPKLTTMEAINQEAVPGPISVKVPLTATGIANRALPWLAEKSMDAYNAARTAMQQQYQAELMKAFTSPDLDTLGRALRQAKDAPSRTAAVVSWLGGKLQAAAPAMQTPLAAAAVAGAQGSPSNDAQDRDALLRRAMTLPPAEARRLLQR